jgi:hypothetical protein
MLASQAEKHKQMLSALKQMQAQQNNKNQAQINSGMASQQAAPGQNPMAGDNNGPA